jgi:hypothetical protein
VWDWAWFVKFGVWCLVWCLVVAGSQTPDTAFPIPHQTVGSGVLENDKSIISLNIRNIQVFWLVL